MPLENMSPLHIPSFFVIMYMFNVFYYPTALKGCQGIVFTHGVQMGGGVVGGKKFVCTVSQNPYGVGS